MFFFNVEGDGPDRFKHRLSYVKLTEQYVLEYISVYLMVRG